MQFFCYIPISETFQRSLTLSFGLIPKLTKKNCRQIQRWFVVFPIATCKGNDAQNEGTTFHFTNPIKSTDPYSYSNFLRLSLQVIITTFCLPFVGYLTCIHMIYLSIRFMFHDDDMNINNYNSCALEDRLISRILCRHAS